MTSLADIADYTYGADISKAESKGERKLKATGKYRRTVTSYANPRSKTYVRRGTYWDRVGQRNTQGMKSGVKGAAIGGGAGAVGGGLVGAGSAGWRGAAAGAALGAGLGAYGGAVMGQNAGVRRAFHGEMKRGDVVAFHRKTGSRAKNWNDTWGNYQY